MRPVSPVDRYLMAVALALPLSAGSRVWDDIAAAEAAWERGEVAQAEAAVRAVLPVATKSGELAPRIRLHRLLAFLAMDRFDLAAATNETRQAAALQRLQLAELLAEGATAETVAVLAEAQPFTLVGTLGDPGLLSIQALAFKNVVADTLAAEARGGAGAAGRESVVPAAPASGEDLWLPIERDTAVLEFIRYDHYFGQRRFEPRYGVLVLTRQGASWFHAGAADEVDAAVGQLLANAHSGGKGEIVDRAFAWLGRTLWTALAPGLPPETRRLILAPDAALQLLPFALLPDPAGQRLVERYEVVTVPSRRVLQRDRSPSVPNPDWLLVGAPALRRGVPEIGEEALPGAEGRTAARDPLHTWWSPLAGAAAEVRAVAARAPVGAEPLLDAAADELAVRSRLVARPVVAHFATHGYYFDEFTLRRPQGRAINVTHPLERSGLALAFAQDTLDAWRAGTIPPPETDGLLNALELAALNLAGLRLVVLSACDTGRGRVVSGEGVLGLRSAFQQAGVGALVYTLWPVADQGTALFMGDFYAAWKPEQPPAAAFRRAQLQQLQRFSHRGSAELLYQVGPYVLCGFDRSVLADPSFSGARFLPPSP